MMTEADARLYSHWERIKGEIRSMYAYAAWHMEPEKYRVFKDKCETFIRKISSAHFNQPQ